MENKKAVDKKTELKKRTITALIIIPIIAGVIYAGGVVFNLAIALLLLQMLREFFAMEKQTLYSPLAMATVFTTASCCLSLIYIEQLSVWAIIWLVCVIAATDVGAFFAGRAFGKHKIWPKVSPNKSWEGAIGGFAFAALVSGWFGQPAYLGVIIGFVAQVGDFTESAMKRKFGVKDSGTLLPGHGGVLDRADGYLFAAPLAAILHYAGVITW